MVKKSGGRTCDCQGASRFGQSHGTQLRGKACVLALVGREVAIAVTIHDKMFTLWQKGASNGKLREEVRARYETIYHKFNMRVLK